SCVPAAKPQVKPGTVRMMFARTTSELRAKFATPDPTRTPFQGVRGRGAARLCRSRPPPTWQTRPTSTSQLRTASALSADCRPAIADTCDSWRRHDRDPRAAAPARVPHLRAHHLALVATAQAGAVRGRRRQRDDPPPHLRRGPRPGRLAPPTPRHTAHPGVPRRTGGTPPRPSRRGPPMSESRRYRPDVVASWVGRVRV